MKKILFIAAIGCLFAACKKSSSTTPTTTTPTTTIPTDGWTLNGTKYKQVYCMRQTNQVVLNCLDATQNPINSFAAFFKTFPTASGTYHIVKLVPDSSVSVPGSVIGANDVIIMGSVPNTATADKSYWTFGAETKDATVTVTNGKIKIEVPEVKVTDTHDTFKITGTMIEN